MKPGEIIHDRFVIERFVARGGMGEVFRAMDRQSGQPVALKLMASEEEHLAERFGLEARALLELDHPAIVRYVAHGFAPGVGLYLAMEWLEGVTLGARFRRGALTIDESLRLCARVADGLGAAHRLGMVHRDVKPGNLFLVGGRVDAVKVLDFGIVRNPWQQITATGAGMGTPEYMAPEQARCERNVGPPADVFALGCVLYRCVAGQPAFQGKQVKAILAKIAMLEQPPHARDVRADVPGVVDELIATMMLHDPAARPADGLAAAEAIRHVRARLAGSERAQTPPPVASLTTSEQLPVAVLFVDLERRTRRANRPTPVEQRADALAHTVRVDSDPAALDTSMRPDEDPAVGLVRQTVEPIGGRVVPLANGSLVVMLSGGAAAPDLAARAARCALAIRAIQPGAAIALATRQVVVDDYRAAAPVIDGAAAMARSQRILIDKRTRELLPEHFDVEGDEAAGFALVGERPPEGVPRRLLGRAMPYVGRQSVLRQLQAAVDGGIEEGTAHAVVVVGDAGVGKSRLRAEVLASVRETRRDLTVVQAFCDPLRSGVPGGVIARAVRAYLNLPEGPLGARQAVLRMRVSARLPEADQVRVAEFLGQLVGVPLPTQDSPALRAAHKDPQLMADQKRRAFEDWLAAECAAQPVVLVIDDLHWSDPVSVELVGAALRRCRDLPLVVLAFSRGEVHQRFPKLDEDWGRQEIRLDPLRPQACEQLAREALGAQAEPSLVRQLVERSGGNPFYLEELIRAAVSAEPQSLPQSVLASMQLRIGRKPPRARQVLRAASVFGRVFWGGGVAALLGGEMERAELDEWLALLERDELVERRAESRAFPGEVEYAFRHDLLRDASYQMLTPEDRMIGHRLAGAWLVEGGEADAVVLAEHFAGGGATEQAVEWFERAAAKALAGGEADVEALRKAASYYRRAGETCAAAYANDSAIAYLERAAALWTPLDLAEAARTRLELAKVRERAGERERAMEDLRAAEDAADKGAARAEVRVEILLQRAQLEMRGGGEGAMEKARQTGERALAMARGAGGTRLLEARALATLAVAHVRLESAESSRKALELLQRALTLLDERAPLADAMWRLGNAFLISNDLDRAARLYSDVLQMAESSKDELLTSQCLANLGMVAFRRWQIDDAIDRTRRALAGFERIGYRTRILEMTLNAGCFHQVRGDHARGRELLETVIAEAEGDWILTTLAQEMLADAERIAGHEMRAQAHLLSAARICERVGVPKRQAFFLGQLAESLWAAGEPALAIDTLEQAARVAKALTLSHAYLLAYLGPIDEALEWLERFAQAEPDPQRRIGASLALARVHSWSRGTREALRICDELLEMTRSSPVPRYRLPVECLRHALCGEHAEAVSTFAGLGAFCAPHERAEAALDVGAALSEGAPPPVVAQYLQISANVTHRGLRHRLEDLRATLYEATGDAERARASFDASRKALDSLYERLSTEYRERLDEHPWVLAIRRVRAVP